MATQLLLIEDVDDLGRAGDIVKVRPGYARNFLLPQKKAMVANKQALHRQAKLQEERKKRAVEDKKSSEAIAKLLDSVMLTKAVKVDTEGHLYGSVSAVDIVHLLEKEKAIIIEKKHVVLSHPIKTLGMHTIQLKLKEGILASFSLEIVQEA